MEPPFWADMGSAAIKTLGCAVLGIVCVRDPGSGG
jgi:hypothetical protein